MHVTQNYILEDLVNWVHFVYERWVILVFLKSGTHETDLEATYCM